MEEGSGASAFQDTARFLVWRERNFVMCKGVKRVTIVDDVMIHVAFVKTGGGGTTMVLC